MKQTKQWNEEFSLGKLLALGVVLLSLAVPAQSRRKIIERIVARVNGEIITLSQIKETTEQLKAEAAKNPDSLNAQKQFEEAKKNLLRDRIDEALLVQKAKDLGVNVDTQVIKYLDQLREDFSLETIEDLQDMADNQGIPWEDFRERITRQYMTREVIWREVRSRIIISREEVRKYYVENKEQYRRDEEANLLQIMISLKDREPEEAEKIAQEVLKKIEEEEDFATLARKYSDHSTASAGGDTGWFKRGTMNAEFEKLAFELPVGETSGILRTEEDLRIVQVAGRHEAGIAGFEEMESQITEFLYAKEMQPEVRAYLTRLRKESYIRIIQGYVDAGAAPEDPPIQARRRTLPTQ